MERPGAKVKEQVSSGHRLPQGSGLDELRGRQLLSFFPGHGWYVGEVLACRLREDVGRLFHVRYTDLDEEELTWLELQPKLLPLQPGAETAGGRGWEQALTAAAQAVPWSAASAPLGARGAGPAASGDSKLAGTDATEPTACTWRSPSVCNGGTAVAGGTVHATANHERHTGEPPAASSPHSQPEAPSDRRQVDDLAPAAANYRCHTTDPLAVAHHSSALPTTALGTLKLATSKQPASKAVPNALQELNTVERPQGVGGKREVKAASPVPLAAAAKSTPHRKVAIAIAANHKPWATPAPLTGICTRRSTLRSARQK
ncbi:hypothetical protein CYMTET_17508, partial [Cymbomonas tetramitiformis]